MPHLKKNQQKLTHPRKMVQFLSQFVTAPLAAMTCVGRWCHAPTFVGRRSSLCHAGLWAARQITGFSGAAWYFPSVNPTRQVPALPLCPVLAEGRSVTESDLRSPLTALLGATSLDAELCGWKEGGRSKFSANDLRGIQVLTPKIGPDPDFFNRCLACSATAVVPVACSTRMGCDLAK